MEVRHRARESGGLAAGEGRQWEALSGEAKGEEKSGMRSKLREMRGNAKGVSDEKILEVERNQLNGNVDGTEKFFTTSATINSSSAWRRTKSNVSPPPTTRPPYLGSSTFEEYMRQASRPPRTSLAPPL